MDNVKLVFTNIYEKNLWLCDESVSGTGSTMKETIKLREELPRLLNSLKVKIFLDAPCGDFNWMKHVNLNVDKYIGVDIVEDLINKNNKKYSNEKRYFAYKNILTDSLPYADLIMSRDCLVHLTYNNIFETISNFKKSGSKYLLATTFPGLKENLDMDKVGNWRPLNLELHPFNFPKPLKVINEELKLDPIHKGSLNQEEFERLQKLNNIFQTKSLGLWKLDDLKNF